MSNQSGRSYLPSGLLTGLQEELLKQDMHRTFGQLPDETLSDSQYIPRMLREWAVDGFIVNYNKSIPQAMIDLIDRHKVPSVWINALDRPASVRPDDVSAGLQATKHLLELGHRRIAFLRFGNSDHYNTRHRASGYEQAMKAAGLGRQVIHSPDACLMVGPGDNRLEIARQVLTATDRPTVFVTYSPGEADALMLAAMSLGIRVPRDLSIITIADYFAGAGGIPITVMQIFQNAVGEEAVRMLLERIENPEVRIEPVLVPLKLLRGATTAEAPSS